MRGLRGSLTCGTARKEGKRHPKRRFDLCAIIENPWKRGKLVSIIPRLRRTWVSVPYKLQSVGKESASASKYAAQSPQVWNKQEGEWGAISAVGAPDTVFLFHFVWHTPLSMISKLDLVGDEICAIADSQRKILLPAPRCLSHCPPGPGKNDSSVTASFICSI
jgi:hypothetical protein